MHNLFRINTRHRPFYLTVDVHTTEPRDIVFVGMDRDLKKNVYFERRKRINGTEKIEIPVPYSPNVLLFRVYDILDSKDNKGFLSVKNVSYEIRKPKDLGFSKETQGIIDFILDFSINIHNYSLGEYKDKNGIIKIEYLDKIYHESGLEHTTPARIYKIKNVIQVSRNKFSDCTVAERVALLLHEVAHNLMNSNPDDEEEADKNAIIIYDKLGFPDTEFFYAFAKIFANNNVQMERLIKQKYELNKANFGF